MSESKKLLAAAIVAVGLLRQLPCSDDDQRICVDQVATHLQNRVEYLLGSELDMLIGWQAYNDFLTGEDGPSNEQRGRVKEVER